MRKILHDKLRQGRVRSGVMRSTDDDGHAGCFIVIGPKGATLRVMSNGNDGSDWEHVSVSLDHRVPNWAEMSMVKDLFWGENECVVQYHPAKSEYVNIHPNCLHLWRLVDGSFPMPPILMV
jgi:hypothetical protein